MEKTLDNVSPETAKANVEDIKVHGHPNSWICISKASSEGQGWMKSTKVMLVDHLGVLVQVSTQQKNVDGTHAVAEALQFIPGVVLVQDRFGYYLKNGLASEEVDSIVGTLIEE
jgi:hypothetical protein